jgi:hypothetical protein
MKKNKYLWFSLFCLFIGIMFISYARFSKPEIITKTANSKVNSINDVSGAPAEQNMSEQAVSLTRQMVAAKASFKAGGTQALSPAVSMGRSSQLVSTVAGHPVAYPGEFAKASVQVDGKSYQLTPNQLGNFQRINIPAKGVVQVSVAYPQNQAGDAVAVEVVDGGQLNKGQMSEVAELDEQKNVQFQFQATDQSGIYRIALRSGADVKVLNFWVGQE